MLLAKTKSTIYSWEDDILVSTIKKNHAMDLMDVAENTETRSQLKLPSPYPVLLDIRALPDMSLPAIIATANQKDISNFSAVALVAKETIHQLIARESKRFGALKVPFRVFASKEEAVDWLKTYLD
jgi:hypothetical protein